ncbi:MAG: hypothetical protein ACOC3X_01115 [Nanoarchaeota archaeon]
MDEKKTIKRETAKKVKIKEIKEGKYIKIDEEWEPNYVETVSGKKVSRINVLGSVVSEVTTEGGNSFLFDDGSDNITIRSFEEFKTDIKLGDILLIIGRPREFSNEFYILPEIIKKIEKDKEKWIELRKIELNSYDDEKKVETIKKEEEEKSINQEEKDDVKLNSFDLVLNVIKELDKDDDGAEIEAIIEKVGLDRETTENVINNLLMDGEAFEIKPGRLKLL